MTAEVAPAMDKPQQQLFPIVALRDLVVFPQSIMPIAVTRPRAIAALDRAGESQNLVLLVTQKNTTVRKLIGKAHG